ncbi:MAG: hypothetical protein ABJN69_02500 [Hellea sp.]
MYNFNRLSRWGFEVEFGDDGSYAPFTVSLLPSQTFAPQAFSAIFINPEDGIVAAPAPAEPLSMAPPASFELSSLLAVNGGDGSTGFVINGIDTNNWSGRSVSAAGDVNGDGIDDILIGAYIAAPNGNSLAGESYVVFGQDDSVTPFAASLNLSALDGTNGFVINGIDANDQSGVSVSAAGDVNGDGIDDILIGADRADPNGNMDAGESYVVFGQDDSVTPFAASLNLSGLDGSNGFVINGIAASDQSGYSVSAAGDVNGDGIDDILIGAFQADPNGNSRAGESYVVFGQDDSVTPFAANLNLSALDGSNGFVINGIDANDRSGISVSAAGDVNGDGIDDILIGAYIAAPNGNSGAGESYVVFGQDDSVTPFAASLNLSALDGTNGFVINGIDANDQSGISVSGAGDVNGDGIDDILIGASLADPNGNGVAGESYVVFGQDDSVTPFAASLNLSALDGTNGFVINGIDASDLSGVSVSAAGDFNGDGIDDILIGAERADPNGNTDAGESYVVFGQDDSVTPFAASLNLSALNGTNGMIINGIDAGDNSGYSVSAAGDVNDDGIDDILIGAYLADSNSNSDVGESYVVFGSADFGPPPPPPASFELSSLLAANGGDGSTGFVINGIDAGDFSGHSVSSAGDVNGDGIDDIIIGAVLAESNGNSGAGESYVVFGQDDSVTPFGASLNLSALDGSNGFVINGIDVQDLSGRSVSAAGDINGDGIDDILIGADRADSNGNVDTGESYVVFGQDDSVTPFAASLDLSMLNGTNGFVINGIDASDYSGISVSSAGDINGDGFDDILIGAFRADPNGNSSAGESYVVFGQDDSVTPFGASLNLSALDGSNGFVINGIDANDLSGGSVSAAGDVNGDGIDDILIGASFADPNGFSSGESYVVFGQDDSVTPFAASLNLSALDGSNGFVVNGINANDNSGISVSAAGDINGDGIDDILISAQLFESTIAGPGGGSNFINVTYVVFGQDDSITPFAASLNLSALDGTNGFVINDIGITTDSPMSVSGAGDFNGDGIDDILIGSGSSSQAGGSYVIFGSNTGFAASLELSSLNGTNGMAINGIDAGDFSGHSVSSAGDVNGDGFDDILIGARYADPNGNNNAGESYVIFGSASFGPAPTGPTAGDDNLTGTAGDDVIDLGTGNDIYDGGDGNDQITGGAGADDLDGGAGFDYTQYNNAAAGVNLSLVSGGTAGDAAGDTFANIEGAVGSNFNDAIGGSSVDNTLFGLGGNDRLFGLDGNDTLIGGDGNDQLWGGAGADRMLGGTGTDSVYYITAAAGIALSLATGGTGGEAAGDSFGSIEQVFATNFNDVVVGLGGDETFYGMDGNDILSGAAGNDTLIGGDGNDTLYGGEGADSLQGGSGIDLASYAQSRSGVTVNLATNANSGGDAAGDMLVGVENLFGSRFGDNLTGDLRDNLINGLGGNDVIDGAAGNDTLYAGAGSDVLNGGAGDDTLSGQSGFNRLNGDAGNDLILGGSDQDFINGGAGDDIMSGGLGTDRFIFEADHGTDRINDFTDGTDLIDLSALGIAFADLTLVQTSQNVEIDTGEGIIIVNNAMVADFDTTDFVF